VGRAGNVKKSAFWIDGKVVKAAFSSDVKDLADLIRANLCRGGRLPVDPPCTEHYQGERDKSIQ
jgi:hypothetical protein